MHHAYVLLAIDERRRAFERDAARHRLAATRRSPRWRRRAA